MIIRRSATRKKKELWALARKHGYEFRRHMPASPIGAEGAITVVTPRVRGRPLAVVASVLPRVAGEHR